jgi:hypothetical protein
MWNDLWNENWQGNLKYSEKTYPNETLSVINLTSRDAWPPQWTLTANRLIYGTALQIVN